VADVPRAAYLGDLGCVAEAIALFQGIRLSLCLVEETDDATAVEAVARRAGAACVRVRSIADVRSALSPAAPLDLGILGNFGILLPADVLTIPRKGWVNLHLGLLPENPGRHPIVAVLRQGERVTGVTLHRAVEKADAGAVIARRVVSVGESPDPASILDRLSGVSASLLSEHLPSLLL